MLPVTLIALVLLLTSPQIPNHVYGQDDTEYLADSSSTYNQRFFSKPDIIKEEAHPFGYGPLDGPKTWPRSYPGCGGRYQSPIDIKLQDVQQALFEPFHRNNYMALPSYLVVQNNGHTLQVSGTWQYGETPSISGGPLTNEYQLQQLHFHWGLNDNTGSEHIVNGESYPLELHAVHWNTKYGSYDSAVEHKDGLAVAAYFFQISSDPNPILELLLREAVFVEGSQEKQTPVTQPFPMGSLIHEQTEFVTYLGSLTTPPCSEIVTWLVFNEALAISRQQLQIIRSIIKDASNVNFSNFRPVQPLYDRLVFINSLSTLL